LNKIDLPQAEPERVCQEIEEIIGIDASAAISVSAKTGVGVRDLLESLVELIPPPKDYREEPLQALIIDSWFDNYLGVVSLIKVIKGRIKKKDKFIIHSTGKTHQADAVGIFTPKRTETDSLASGEVGLLWPGLKRCEAHLLGIPL